MSFEHGVVVNEQPTGVKPPVQISAGLPVYIGTAQVNAGDPTFVNKPGVFNTLEEAVAALGPIAPSSAWGEYTLHEAVKAHFSVYGVGPIVCINVLDPSNDGHVQSATGQSHQLVKGKVKLQPYGGPDELQLGIIKSSVVVKKGVTTMTLNTDYTLAFDDSGYLEVSIVSGGALSASDVILVDFDYLDPSAVTSSTIIGGYDVDTDKYTGIEVVEQVFPRLRLVPGFLLAPKWSQVPTVAAALNAKAPSINGAFKAEELVDLSTDKGTIATYSAAPTWKSDNGYTGAFQFVTWPLVKFGDDVYHASTIAACVANLVDSARDGVPYASPSNQAVDADAAVLDDGTEVLLTTPQANSLNAQGIATILNTFNGWKLWGNRTGAYPDDTDPKNAFLPVRRMFNWMENTIILTTQSFVDQPGNRRQIDSVRGSIQSWLNNLIAVGALVDGKIEFRSSENSTTDLSDGKITWHITATPPSPNEQMVFNVEYDPAALAALFQ